MKRPRALLFIVAWCGLALLVQSSHLTRPMRAYQAAGEAIPALWHYLPLLALGFSIWQVVGLFRLQRFNRWFAVVFFLGWTGMMFWKFAFFSGPLAPGRMFLVLSIVGIPNVLSAWYLARRSFREFAVKFVAERESRLMQIAAQKNTLNDIRKNRIR